ncbi:MAG TPA: dephospho-CoA kinase [Candidatus Eisenbacteria bacterium]
MLSVGLTGNIASGKSMVAAQLESLGAVVIDADRIGHVLIGSGGAAVDEVRAAFGPGVVGQEGGIDRALLGPVVFADPAARERLNAIVHPRLVAEIRRRMEGMASAESREDWEGGPPVPLILVVDAALIFELDMAGDFDVVVVVSAPEAVREARLVAKGLTAEEARRRIASQWPEVEKVRRADHVIVNDGAPERLAADVEQLWKILTRAAASPSHRKDR